jgi:hypothetical protein
VDKTTEDKKIQIKKPDGTIILLEGVLRSGPSRLSKGLLKNSRFTGIKLFFVAREEH